MRTRSSTDRCCSNRRTSSSLFIASKTAQITRIRSYSANCALDAGGKAVHWFTGVSVNDSVAYMKTFMRRQRGSQDERFGGDRIGHDRRPAAAERTGRPRRQWHDHQACKGNALFWLAQRAGQKAVGTITAAIENDPDTEVKKKAVFALSQLPKDEGVPLLIQQARTNKNPAVRKQAMFWLGQSKDPRALKFFEEILR